MGVLINELFFHVKRNDLSNYPNLMIVAFCFSFLGFFLLPLISLKSEILEAKSAREK